MMIFKDRQSAGKLLAKRLTDFKQKPETLVIAIPRGGVAVGKEISKALKLPLDIIITRKIGAPFQKELALGAIDPNGNVTLDNVLLSEYNLKPEELDQEIQNQLKEIKRREKEYRGQKSKPDLAGKTVILVDDGIATGATTLSAIKYLKSEKVKKIILAVPVVAKDTADSLRPRVNQLATLTEPDYLGAVGSFYQNFQEVTDSEVKALLKNQN